MSRTIDERVVSMQFDNRSFESNVQTSLGTLDKLKAKLNLSGATKGLEEIDSASRKVNFSMLGRAVDTIQVKFSAMQVMGVTALANLTNSAVNAGKRIANALTIEPIKTGFQEYETQIGAVQTILANTESKGTTLQDVNRALDELNTYADKTIYNFTQMTKNIGTFTAAGVDLETSVNSIKGIANLAAVSGSTSQQASTAMYQLSQALAAGKVSLMDWNSVVNAGMGGQVFQDALKRTSELLGTGADAAIKKYGSFRESLTQGNWLTTEVLTKTLEQFTMAAEEGTEQWTLYKKSLMDEGYTEKQALEILKMANTATDAATKVKTFTQLWDTLKESAQSGWTQTWEIMIGDFGEAKEFLTSISDTIGGMLNSSADVRNKLLSGGLSSGWKQLLNAGIADEAGYTDTIKTVAKEYGVSIDEMIKSEKELDASLSDTEAFQKVLKTGLKDGSITAEMMAKSVHALSDKMSKMSSVEREAAGYTAEHVTEIKALSEGLKDGSISMDDFVTKITRSSGRENLIESLWNSFNALLALIKPVKDAFSEIFPAMTGEQLYSITENLKEFTSKLTIGGATADKIKRTFKGLFSVAEMFGKVLSSVAKVAGRFLTGEGVSGVIDLLLTLTASIGDFFTSLNDSFQLDGFTGSFTKIVDTISEAIGRATGGISGMGDVLSKVGGYIVETLKFIGSGLSEAFAWIGENVGAGDIFAGLAGGGIALAGTKIAGVFGKIKKVLDNFFGGNKIKVIEKVGIIDKIKDVFDSLSDSLQAFTSSVKIGSLVAIAASIGILSASLGSIADLKVENIVKALFAMGAMFTMLNVSFKSISKSLGVFEPKGIIKAGITLVLLAKAIDILAGAMGKIGNLSLKELAKGLLGVGIGIAELVGGLKAIDGANIKLTTSAAILALAKACENLADAVSKFAKMSWDEIGRGLTAMGGALAELVAVLKVMDKIDGFNSLMSGGSLVIAVQSLDELSENLDKFGKMKWDEIGRGLTAMGGALAELGATVGLLGHFTGFSSILGGGALVIGAKALDDLASALQEFAYLQWDAIGRGLSAMGGALAELGATVGLLGYFTGFSGILGGGALVIGVQALDELAEALKKFGDMDWNSIGRGLAAMGGALTELGLVVGLLGGFTHVLGLLGAASLWIAIQGLDDLANALKKFGDMQWDEIGRGLTAMGGALAVVAGGSFLNTIGVIGSMSIENVVGPLNELAEALQKFGDMSWGEIQRGLAAMGLALAEVAGGNFLNTIGIIGSKAISEVAKPLGDLADSIKKWKDVDVPEGLGLKLAGLAAAITSFTLGGLGALAIAAVAKPLGDMADSIKKWKDVVVPEGLPEQVGSLAGAIEKYTLGGLGAITIAEVAKPLGDFADSVKKWQDVVIPEGLSDKLSGLANAIGAFSFTFMGGWSLSTIAGPFGDFTEAVKKWKDVTIPEGLSEDLSELADGIGAFSFGFMSGWSLDTIVEPLGGMAKAVKKWNGVVIPGDLPDKLKGLAGALKSFVGIGMLSTATDGFKKIADGVAKLAKVKMDTVTGGLSSLSSELTNFANSSESLKGVGDTIVNNIVKPVEDAASKLETAGSKMIDAIAKGVDSNALVVTTSVGEIITDVIDDVADKETAMESAGTTLTNALISALRGSYHSLFAAGSYLVDGFASGISANKYKAAAQAKAMAGAAAEAARRELDEHSPSRVGYEIGDFFGVAVANGIGDNISKVFNMSTELAASAKNGLSNTISKISDFINNDIDTQPTIRPVLDLSDVSSGAYAINSMLSMSPSVGVLSNVGYINSAMNSRQNGGNDDVISAINGLKKALGERTGDTYNVNGISYNEGSDVATAIKALTRAVKMEGRS